MVLRGSSWTKGVAVAVLQLQLPFSVALRVLRGQKVLQLPFLKLPLQFFAALRGPSRSFVDKRSCSCRPPRPRNAPPWLPTLQVLSHLRGMPTANPYQSGCGQPYTPPKRLTGGEENELVKTNTLCGLVPTSSLSGRDSPTGGVASHSAPGDDQLRVDRKKAFRRKAGFALVTEVFAGPIASIFATEILVYPLH